MRLVVVIPVFNEGERIFVTVLNLIKVIGLKRGEFHRPLDFVDIILVDDGSSTGIDKVKLSGLLRNESWVELYLLTHPFNLGQGAALQTGISYAWENLDSDYFVTFDADGQHSPEFLPLLINTLDERDLDIVFGNRFGSVKPENMPWLRSVILKFAVSFESLITGVKLSDAHNGFRVFNRKAAGAINLKQNRMAHATEFKQIVSRNRFRYGEVDTSVVYSGETLDKGQRSSGSLVILRDLLKIYLFNG